MSVPPIAHPVRYVDAEGRLTVDGLVLLSEMRSEIERLSKFVESVSGVGKATGGTTVDAEARAAVNKIITAAS